MWWQLKLFSISEFYEKIAEFIGILIFIRRLMFVNFIIAVISVFEIIGFLLQVSENYNNF